MAVAELGGWVGVVAGGSSAHHGSSGAGWVGGCGGGREAGRTLSEGSWEVTCRNAGTDTAIGGRMRVRQARQANRNASG